MTRWVGLLGALLLAACGGGGVPAALATATAAQTASPTPAPTATASPEPTAVAGSLTFTVAAGSKAVVRVTEQLADRQDLSDAVLTTEKVSGEFTLLPDGTFSPSSRIVVDLNALASDNRQRDSFIKQTTLETRQFPEARFVPTKAEGLPLPLPAAADMKFTLAGKMTVHGVTKDVSFAVVATRASSDLNATATVDPTLRFATFGMSQPRVFSVISIKDDIRLEIQLVAKQKG